MILVVLRTVVRILLVLNALLLPLAALAAIIVFNMLNPMQATFITGFTIENRTSHSLLVTPVGTVGQKGHRSLLPVYLCTFPAIPVIQRRDFPVAAGGSIDILYDWDDINLSEILVVDEAGGRYEMVVDPMPTKHQYHPPKNDRLVIQDLKGLGMTSSSVIEAYGRKEIGWLIYALAIVGGVILASFIWLFRINRKLARYSQLHVANNSPVNDTC